MKIILVETEGAANIGSAARIMKNFGHKNLYLLKPKCKITEETKKMACNAQDILEQTKIINKLSESKADYFIGTTALKGGDYNIPRAASQISTLPDSEKVALVLGNESQGLSKQLLEEMDALIRIDANPKYNTLNITHALGIILYQFYNTENDKAELATASQKSRLIQLFINNMNKNDMNEHQKKTAELAFKKLLGRAAITKREIQALFGSFKRI